MDPTQNPAGNQPAANDAASNDASEWDQAGLDFLSDRGVEAPDKRTEEQGAIQDNNGGDGVQSDPNAKKTPEGGDGSAKPGEGTDPQHPQGDGKNDVQPNGEAPTGTPENQPQPSQEQADRDFRRRQLELEADRKELSTDIRKELFSDQPTRLEDADGDPIETIADVMRLENPITKKPFTAEEASQWLMQAQRNFEKNQEKTQKEIDEIVEVNLSIKEQADSVKTKYGELLKHMPKLRARVWEQYKATLQTHEGTDIIKKAPVPMEAFYDTILAPYMREVDRLKKDAEADKQRQEEAEKRKKEAEEKKKQSQGDREDIFSTRTKIESISDPEEKEWAQAAKEYYEG